MVAMLPPPRLRAGLQRLLEAEEARKLHDEHLLRQVRQHVNVSSSTQSEVAQCQVTALGWA